jgi:hypothetical protein
MAGQFSVATASRQRGNDEEIALESWHVTARL